MKQPRTVERTLVGLLLWLAAIPSLPGSEAGRLESLMAALAEVNQASALFREERRMSFLDHSLELTGTLEYRAPDYLEKRVLTPALQVFRLESRELSLERGGERLSVVLADAPVAGVLVESLRATLAGDLTALQSGYRTDHSHRGDEWELRLHPREPAIRRFLAQIRIRGEGTQIREIELEEPSGDLSSMFLTPIETPAPGGAGR